MRLKDITIYMETYRKIKRFCIKHIIISHTSWRNASPLRLAVNQWRNNCTGIVITITRVSKMIYYLKSNTWHFWLTNLLQLIYIFLRIHTYMCENESITNDYYYTLHIRTALWKTKIIRHLIHSGLEGLHLLYYISRLYSPTVSALECEARVMRSIHSSSELKRCITCTDNMLWPGGHYGLGKCLIHESLDLTSCD